MASIEDRKGPRADRSRALQKFMTGVVAAVASAAPAGATTGHDDSAVQSRNRTAVTRVLGPEETLAHNRIGPDGGRQWTLSKTGGVPLALARLPAIFRNHPEVGGFYYPSWEVAAQHHPWSEVGRAMLDHYVTYGQSQVDDKLRGEDFLSPANVTCAVLMKAFTNLEFQTEVRFESKRLTSANDSGNPHELRVKLERSQVDFVLFDPIKGEHIVLDYHPTVREVDGKLYINQHRRYFKRDHKPDFRNDAADDEASDSPRTRRTASKLKPQSPHKKALHELLNLKRAVESGYLSGPAAEKRIAALSDLLAREYFKLRQSQLRDSDLADKKLVIITDCWEFRRKILMNYAREGLSIPRADFRPLFEAVLYTAIERFKDRHIPAAAQPPPYATPRDLRKLA